MLVLGIAFLIFAALVQLANWSVVAAAAVVGVVAIVFSLVSGEHWPTHRP